VVECLIQAEVQQYYAASETIISGSHIPKPIIHFAEASFPGSAKLFFSALVNT